MVQIGSPLRESNLKALADRVFDVVVIGGGINGASSAAALASHGVSVGLIERGDFAGTTSQESSNLVWGGFKYLENYEIPLVFNLCRSRNRLMDSFPTRIAETGFLATLDRSSPFPSWLAALGTVGYWGIGQFATSRPHYYRADTVEAIEPIINTTTADGAIEYSDGLLLDNDSRFVWQFVQSALRSGAAAANYTEVTAAEWSKTDRIWTLTVVDGVSFDEFTVTARSIVNAAGPFVDNLNAKQLELETKHRIVYSKGIHLVVPRLGQGDKVLAFFDDTQRLFYVIPMAHRSVIGTTDTRTADANEGVTDEDREFLLRQINARLDLDEPLTVDDVLGERCGVRPLVVPNDGDDRNEIDWTNLSRRHEVEVDGGRNVITIFGGKITDCLNIGEEILGEVGRLGIKIGHDNDNWFGEPPAAAKATFCRRAGQLGLSRRPGVERATTMAELLWRRHGIDAYDIIDLIESDETLGEEILADSDILAAEVKHMAETEMIVTMDDFLRRRTKLSLIHRRSDLEADPGYGRLQELLGL